MSAVKDVLRSQPFPGFKTGGEICDVLTKSHNNDLREFTVTLFK